MSTQAATSRFDAAFQFGKTHGKYLWLVGLSLYVGVIWFVGWQDVRNAISIIDIRFVFAFMAVEVVGLALRAWKWRIALGPNQQSLRACFISKAGGNLTPGRVGEFSPLLFTEHRSARIGAWIILDRVLEASSTILFGIIGLIAVLGLSQGGGLAVWALAIAALLALALFILTREAVAEKFAGKARPGSIIQRALHLFTQVGRELKELRTKAPALASLSLIATALDLCVGYFLFLTFGFGVAFTVLALTQLAHALATVLPLAPNATGIPYVAAMAVIHEVADIPVDILAVAVGLRLITGTAVFWACFGIVVPKKKNQNDFESQGELFDKLAGGDTLYEYAPESLARLRALVSQKGRLLDVGCGDGVIGSALGVENTFGFDISSRCAKLSRGRGLHASVADAIAGLPFPDATFDTVTCIDVLHHLGQRWDVIFPELNRILRPGGTLCIVEPDARNPFVRWTQAPDSPIRVAPWDDEPAIDPAELTPHLESLGLPYSCDPIHIEGQQVERSVFPLWQRLLKAPFVIAAAWWYRNLPNKFSIIAHKPVNAPAHES